MTRIHERLHQLVLVLEASERAHCPEDVVVDGLAVGDDVGLDHFHHGGLQLALALAAGAGPRVPVRLFQLEKNRENAMLSFQLPSCT